MNYNWLCKQVTSHIKYIPLDADFLEELYKCKYWNLYNLFCIETNCGINCMTLNYILGNYNKQGVIVKNFNQLGCYIIMLEGQTFSHSMTLMVEKEHSILLQSYMQHYYMRHDKVDKYKFLIFLKNLGDSKKYVHVELPLNEQYKLEILYYGKIDIERIPDNIRLIESFGANYKLDMYYYIYSIVFLHIALLLPCCK